jgi:hypothetical protein
MLNSERASDPEAVGASDDQKKTTQMIKQGVCGDI